MFASYNPAYRHSASRPFPIQQLRDPHGHRFNPSYRDTEYEYDDDDDDEGDTYFASPRPYQEPRRTYDFWRNRQLQQQSDRQRLLDARKRQEQIKRNQLMDFYRRMNADEKLQPQPQPQPRAAPNKADVHIPIRIHSPPPPQTTKDASNSVPPSTQQPIIQTSAKLTPDEAATKIQSFYRTYRSIRAINALHSQFLTLKSGFALPTTLDFQSHSDGNGKHEFISVSTASLSSERTVSITSTPKLAYTPTNAPLHAYVEALSRLLVTLDGIESHGAKQIREKRRAVVRTIEDEAEAVEKLWRGVWEVHSTSVDVEMEAELESASTNDELQQQEKEEKEVLRMVVEANEEAEVDVNIQPVSSGEATDDVVSLISVAVSQVESRVELHRHDVLETTTATEIVSREEPEPDREPEPQPESLASSTADLSQESDARTASDRSSSVFVTGDSDSGLDHVNMDSDERHLHR